MKIKLLLVIVILGNASFFVYDRLYSPKIITKESDGYIYTYKIKPNADLSKINLAIYSPKIITKESDGYIYTYKIKPNADLSNADLSKINLANGNLSKANFKNSNLSGANLSGANLSGANLNGANLNGANLSGANLSNVNLDGVDFIDLTGRKISNYISSDQIELKSKNLVNANLSGSNLKNCRFEMCNLSGANLSNVTFQECSFGGSNLSNVNLSNSNFKDCSFDKSYDYISYKRNWDWRTNLSGADLSGANLGIVDFRDLNLSGANLSNTDMRNVNFITMPGGGYHEDLDFSFTGVPKLSFPYQCIDGFIKKDLKLKVPSPKQFIEIDDEEILQNLIAEFSMIAPSVEPPEKFYISTNNINNIYSYYKEYEKIDSTYDALVNFNQFYFNNPLYTFKKYNSDFKTFYTCADAFELICEKNTNRTFYSFKPNWEEGLLRFLVEEKTTYPNRIIVKAVMYFSFNNITYPTNLDMYRISYSESFTNLNADTEIVRKKLFNWSEEISKENHIDN